TPTKTPVLSTIPNTDYRIQYGGWKGVKNVSASGGTYYYSSTAGDTSTFNFSGTAATWYTQKSPMAGIAEVWVDNKLKKTVDLYQSTISWNVAIVVNGLASGSHLMTINVTGTANASSAGANVVVDKFKVGTTVTQETSYLIQYNGWKGAKNTAALSGTYRQDNVNNAGGTTDISHETISFNFTGTSVTWVAAKGPTYGQAEVYIDGNDMGMVDLYSSTLKWKQNIAYTGLAAGAHTITIQALGTNSASSTGTRVVFDSFLGVPN
ncbi:MAG: hypothetical protein WCF84_07280, partial [Anaerolineae bacterium]